jgi:NAD(P)-dependent dehydrogenase (short-subunit alcohol dehydrogenase family)
MGAEEARLFAREGAKVVIADVLEAAGKQVESEIKATHGEALFVGTDVTSGLPGVMSADSGVTLWQADILVNNAG